jgi:hypothetical protein
MKLASLTILFYLLLCRNIFAQSEFQYPKYDSLKKNYQVMDIKEISNAYLINVEDEDGYKFTIVSIKRTKQKRTKIEEGKKYDLLFYSIYPPPEEDIILVGGNVIYHDIPIEGIHVKFQGDFDTGILVTSPNLKGLYYIETDETNKTQ